MNNGSYNSEWVGLTYDYDGDGMCTVLLFSALFISHHHDQIVVSNGDYLIIMVLPWLLPLLDESMFFHVIFEGYFRSCLNSTAVLACLPVLCMEEIVVGCW